MHNIYFFILSCHRIFFINAVLFNLYIYIMTMTQISTINIICHIIEICRRFCKAISNSYVDVEYIRCSLFCDRRITNKTNKTDQFMRARVIAISAQIATVQRGLRTTVQGAHGLLVNQVNLVEWSYNFCCVCRRWRWRGRRLFNLYVNQSMIWSSFPVFSWYIFFYYIFLNLNETLFYFHFFGWSLDSFFFWISLK